MKDTLTTRLHRGDLLLGTLVSLPSLEIAEILADAGFDWLWLDLEHSAMGIPEAQAILQAVGERIDCLVRVPLNDEIWIKKVLDTGPAGILVPQVNTADEARRALALSKYPPMGRRSVSGARANRFGLRLQEYIQRVNTDSAVVIQAEHIQAVNNIDSILEVAGIDAVFVGPYDLSASMGLIGQPGHPEVAAAIQRVRAACQAHSVALGIFAATAEQARTYIHQGFTLIGTSGDTLMLVQAAGSLISALRKGG
jgi:2-dehydro-3-deoxyglucarate aldolase